MDEPITEFADSTNWQWEVERDVREERTRQDAKWGTSRNLHPILWQAVLAEEMGEIARAVLEGDLAGYELELVQLAAAAMAALEDWRWRRRYKDALPDAQVIPSAFEAADKGGSDGR